jgi:hypothetical protein
LLTGVLALLLVAPVVAYVLIAFAPTSPETFRQAQSILVHFRIPHHTRVDLWLDLIAGMQITLVLLALFLVRRIALLGVLGVPFALAALLTVVQVLSGSDTLALLFPWRISAVLVPIATCIILSRLVDEIPSWIEKPEARWTAALVGVGLVAGGGWITLTHQGFQVNDNELGVLEEVRKRKQPGEVYFIPVTVPKLAATTHGSLSSDFKPLPGKLVDTRIIPVDMQRFRLATGAPLYVDFKSIPYADLDVLEWRRRINLAEWIGWFQQESEWGQRKALRLLHDEGVTHLVWPASQELTDPGWERMYEDRFYRVYRMRPGALP